MKLDIEGLKREFKSELNTQNWFKTSENSRRMRIKFSLRFALNLQILSGSQNC